MSTEKMESSIANPAPLGLLAFGMTTVLLNLHNAQIVPLSAVILAMGFCVGGAAQIVAGVMEYKKGNTFGATAFSSFGFFWWSIVAIWTNPFPGIAKADGRSLAFYLLLWGIYTTFMFVATLRHGRGLQIVFLSAAILFFMLSIADFTGIKSITVMAGWLGILCGASAMYNSVAQILNNEYGRKVLPL